MSSIGYDANDNATALVPASSTVVDYSAAIYGGTLKGLRIGLVEGFFNRTASNETTPVNDVMSHTISVLRKAGATIVSVNETVYNATALAAFDVQTSEYRQLMDQYLTKTSLNGTHPSSLAELYSSGKFLVIPSQYTYVNTSLASSTSNSSYALKKASIQNLTTALLSTFSSSHLDFLIYPEQKNLVVKLGSPSQSGRNGILAALTGFPVLTVPAAFSKPSSDAEIGVPIGMEIMGVPWSEGRLLNVAAHVKALMHVRRMPAFANASLEGKMYENVPVVVPNVKGISGKYPVGVL